MAHVKFEGLLQVAKPQNRSVTAALSVMGRAAASSCPFSLGFVSNASYFLEWCFE
jgi:hypothetical protein